MPDSLRDKIFKAGRVRDYSYELTSADEEWMVSPVGLDGPAFTRQLLRRRFPDAARRFRTLKKLLHGARGIIRRNAELFARNSRDQSLLSTFRASRPCEARERLRAFRDLCRGYADSELNSTAAQIDGHLIDVENELTKHISRNARLVLQAPQTGGQKRLLCINRDRLDSLARQVARYRAHLHEAAHAALQWRTMLDGSSGLVKWFGPHANDPLQLKRALARYDPNHAAYPLRHLSWLPASRYVSLRRRWVRGSTSQTLLRELGAGLARRSFTRLGEQCGLLDQALTTDRACFVEEIRKDWASKCYLSATLVAITQTEGYLWDFGDSVNSGQCRVFKVKGTRRYPYLWDHERGAYKHKHRNGLPMDSSCLAKNQRRVLASARQLLQMTRVGALVTEDLYSWFVDEFYDDRNNLTHGSIRNRDLRIDAIGAILALWSISWALLGQLRPRP